MKLKKSHEQKTRGLTRPSRRAKNLDVSNGQLSASLTGTHSGGRPFLQQDRTGHARAVCAYSVTRHPSVKGQNRPHGLSSWTPGRLAGARSPRSPRPGEATE